MILLDTCALLWWVFDKGRFPKNARDHIDRMESSKGYASSISIWEIAMKVEKGKIEIPLSVEKLIARIKLSGVMKIVPVDEDIWIKSVKLEWNHRDPADRVIVATSLSMGLPLVTSDGPIRKRWDHAVW